MYIRGSLNGDCIFDSSQFGPSRAFLLWKEGRVRGELRHVHLFVQHRLQPRKQYSQWGSLSTGQTTMQNTVRHFIVYYDFVEIFLHIFFLIYRREYIIFCVIFIITNLQILFIISKILKYAMNGHALQICAHKKTCDSNDKIKIRVLGKSCISTP